MIYQTVVVGMEHILCFLQNHPEIAFILGGTFLHSVVNFLLYDHLKSIGVLTEGFFTDSSWHFYCQDVSREKWGFLDLCDSAIDVAL